MLIFGHRGAPTQCTENTLGGFEHAIELGADGVELDLHLSSDGEVVVFHDEDLQRLAGRPELIRDCTWAQLAEVRLSGGTAIPRLSDVLAAWPADKWLDVELKMNAGGPNDLAERAVEVLAARANTFLSSFDPRLLAAAGRSGWSQSMGMLLEAMSPAFLHASGGRDFGADAVILDAQITSAHAVRRYRDAGQKVGVYGARNSAHERELAELGIDWLISDWPRAL